MRLHRYAAVMFVGLSLALSQGRAAAQSQPQTTVEGVREELLHLPYYGVFDFLAFSYNKGVVTLQGYAYQGSLKIDAERAVKRASGVDQVVDKVEDLPPSAMDDELRWKAYYAIYRDPSLSRYAPGGGMLWGHRHPFGPGFQALGPTRFPGTEPAGDYPIHIIVKNGQITLLGVVDNDGDKNIAGIRAHEIPGAFAVVNDLVVESTKTSTSR
jgi:hyperosmotically inducible protein